MSAGRLWLLALLGCVFALATGVCAQTGTEVALTLDQDYVTKYIWRGLVANEDPAYQPSLTVAASNGLSLNIWGSMDTTSYAGNSGNFTEIDYTLDYAFTRGRAPLNIGVIAYTFPNTPFAGTSEVYLGATWEEVPMAPSAQLYYDFDEVKGFYLSLGCSHIVQKRFRSDKIGDTTLCASLGMASSKYNDAYFGVDESTMADLTLGASLPIRTGKIVLTPSLNYSTLLSSKLRDAVADPDNFYAGIRATYDF